MNGPVPPLPRRPVGFGAYLVLALVGIAGAASLLHYVWVFGTNVPIGDDWDLLRTLLAWRTDGVTASSVFAFHNEHRIVATRLIEGTLIQLFHGNLRIVMLSNAMLVVATLVVFFSFIRTTAAHPLYLVATFATATCLVAGLFQWQNFLWSFQFPWLLLPLLLVSIIWCLCYLHNVVACTACVSLLLSAALACQANGVIVILAAVPAAWARARGRSPLVRSFVPGILIALALVLGALYFADVPSYVPRPGLTAPFGQPRRFVHFVLAVLGSPFSAPISLLGSDHWFGTIAGGLSLAAAALLLLFAVRQGWSGDRRAVLVLALGLLVFSGGSVLAIALGRFTQFSPEAIESRYTTFALYFHVGLVLLFHSIVSRDLPIGPRTGILRITFLLVCLALIGASSWGNARFAQMGLNLKLAQMRYKASLNLSRALPGRPELALQAHTVPPDQLQSLLTALEREGLWVPGRPTSIARKDLQTFATIGNVDQVIDQGDRFVLHGWSRLPDTLPADAIVALAPTDVDALVPVAMSSSDRIARPDLIATFGPDTILGSGWRMEVMKTDFARSPVIAAYSVARNAFFTIPFRSASTGPQHPANH